MPNKSKRRTIRLLSESSASGPGILEQSVATEDEALDLIKESLASAAGDTDFDASGTHVFIVLGASVSLIIYH